MLDRTNSAVLSTLKTQDENGVIAQIRPLWRQRQAWHRAEKSLTLQCKGLCRAFVGGSKTEGSALFARIEKSDVTTEEAWAAMSVAPLLAARAVLEAERTRVEKELAKLAKALPIWSEWAEAVYGVGAVSIAAIVGECGDVGSYKSVSAVWKRMGLAVINGGRQRKKAGDEALEHGYSPARRAVMWNIGGGLIGGMGKGPRPAVGEDVDAHAGWSPYQKMFIQLLRAEVERVTETWNGPEHRRDPVERKGIVYESFSAHAANRIKRRVEKQFLADLYGEWRRLTVRPTNTKDSLLAAATTSAQAERSADIHVSPVSSLPSAPIPDAEQSARGGRCRLDDHSTNAAPPSSPAAKAAGRQTIASVNSVLCLSDGTPTIAARKAARRSAITGLKPSDCAPGAISSKNVGKPARRPASSAVRPNSDPPGVTPITDAAQAAREATGGTHTTICSPPALSASAERRTMDLLKPTVDASGATSSKAAKAARRPSTEAAQTTRPLEVATNPVAEKSARRRAVEFVKPRSGPPAATSGTIT